jgi:hypothetical protein
MRKWIPAAILATMFSVMWASPAFADNPHSPTNPSGQPSQSCQSFSANTRPGQSASSPGAPFNEPGGVNSQNGGTGGAHYSANSQYDVACFQWFQHH